MSGDVRYPGWCCRQIAAQLSQALFTMADLHAQVSDLREENRQLKIKIENIDMRRSEEDISSAKGPEAPLTSSRISAVPPNSTHIEKNYQDVLKQVLNLQNSVKGPCVSNPPLFSEIKQERLVLNVPFKQSSDEEKGGPSQATSPQISGDFKCDKCDYSFPNSALLMTHQAVHFGRSFHICKVCNAMFLLKADLYRHWTTHPNIKQHICQLCGKAYTSKNNYKLHIKTHTGEGLYPCEVCGKAFHSENHLNVHRRIHTGERPYECQFCDKSFTQKSGLINHTRLHTGEKPFLCPSCPKAFTQKSNLNFHLSKHHPVPGDVSLPLPSPSPLPSPPPLPS